jgi:hypothetical protein
MGWFVRMMEELGITCRVGHPATIRQAETRRQKHDRRDAQLLLRLLAEDRFPAIWMPTPELRDLRALLLTAINGCACGPGCRARSTRSRSARRAPAARVVERRGPSGARRRTARAARRASA